MFKHKADVGTFWGHTIPLPKVLPVRSISKHCYFSELLMSDAVMQLHYNSGQPMYEFSLIPSYFVSSCLLLQLIMTMT